MSRPAVTVMVPCFNSEASLRLALGSVAAQTHEDWECVCLDDGSTDGTWEILRSVAATDKRFRVERFEKNRGRGAGRQRILELAEGDYLAFLDSDDWMYPERLAQQLRWFEADSRIAAVSACAAVTDGPTDLVGVMRPPVASLPLVAAFPKPVPPPLLFPTSMIRTDLAKATGFDRSFKRSQDSDFLIRALLGKHYALGSEILYAYSQASAASLSRTLEGYKFRVQAHLRHWRQYPFRVARTVAETGAKMAIYRAAGILGKADRLIERRWAPADETVAAGFSTALEVVRGATATLFS